ncbi:hypothetical protein B0H14DRAFT_3448196 [Mycena olivaceomarginata]|nr:hypothetical protein B0H14DRAFT_3448196 [Mycena olivaceomarginata]
MPVATRSRKAKGPNRTSIPPSQSPDTSHSPHSSNDRGTSDADESADDVTRHEQGNESDAEESEEDTSKDDEEENEEENDDENDSGSDSKDKDDGVSQQVLNARSGHWNPSQDRLLVVQTHADRPFLHHRRSRGEAWEDVASSLRLASANSGGPNSCITRSGEACRVRFNLLRKKYKADEARSLQKTGTDEEVDEFIKLLGKLCALADAENTPGTKAAMHKTDVEGRAGRELRDASMTGLVRGDGLVDVASLDGATVRERQGQRGKKRKHGDSDQENQSQSLNSASKRRKRKDTALKDILNQRIESDQAALQQCAKQDHERHIQQLAALNKLTDAMQGVNDNICGLREEQEKSNQMLRQQKLDRREEQIRRRETELGI